MMRSWLGAMVSVWLRQLIHSCIRSWATDSGIGSDANRCFYFTHGVNRQQLHPCLPVPACVSVVPADRYPSNPRSADGVRARTDANSTPLRCRRPLPSWWHPYACNQVDPTLYMIPLTHVIIIGPLPLPADHPWPRPCRPNVSTHTSSWHP